ncbi:MFS transporter [Nonomuraea rhodomycinica]|uniref:MFS transporter n=2 Tax=Nonomuraea rhodomycinica TaxID=1712872 RepID=A0A7Y6MBA2_9ACTN|nr:MFS transporter [Nonomuraea rhodomycinica]
MAGTRALGVVYPLLAVLDGRSVVWAGWVVFAWTVPTLLYIPAGALVDRWDPRLVLRWSEVLRGVAIASVVLALAWGRLDVWHLLAVAFFEAAFSVFSSLAETALISAIVRKKDIGNAMAVHESSVHIAVLTGRPLGGLLFGWMPVAPLFANLVLIGGFLTALRGLGGSFGSRDRAPLLQEIRRGITVVRGDAFLRVATWLTASTNMIFQALVIVFIASGVDHGTSPLVTGLVLAASGVGGLVGSLVAPRRGRVAAWLSRWTDRRPLVGKVTDHAGLTRRGRSTLVLHAWLWALSLALIASTDAPVFFAAGLVVMGAAGGLSNVTIKTVTSRSHPDLIARVTGFSRLVSYGASAVGPLFGSVLLMVLGVHLTVFALLGLTLLIASLVTWVRRLRRSLSPRWEAVSGHAGATEPSESRGAANDAVYEPQQVTV